MLFFFTPVALLPLIPVVLLQTFIFNILVGFILGAAFSILITGLTDFLRYQRLQKEKIAQLKSRIPAIRGRYETLDSKCIFQFDSPYQRRLDDLQARANNLIALGGSNERLGKNQLNLVDKLQSDYSSYKLEKSALDKKRIENLQIKAESKSLGNYISKKTIAAQLEKRTVKVGAGLAAIVTLILELIPLIDELIQTIDSTIAEIDGLPSQCDQCKSFSISSSGGDEGFNQSYELIPNDEDKSISIKFTAFSVPDQLTISVNAGTIYDSGCIGTGSGGSGQSDVTASVLLPANSTSITININPNCGEGSGTQWTLVIDGLCLK
jgi:hypothetical protein